MRASTSTCSPPTRCTISVLMVETDATLNLFAAVSCEAASKKDSKKRFLMQGPLFVRFGPPFPFPRTGVHSIRHDPYTIGVSVRILRYRLVNLYLWWRVFFRGSGGDGAGSRCDRCSITPAAICSATCWR